ncbi:unnamed protein product, partial [Cuscuta epithymum]
MDIHLNFEEAPSMETEFPMVVSIEDTLMFSQQTKQGSEEAEKGSEESEEHTDQDAEDDCNPEKELRNQHGVIISYG